MEKDKIHVIEKIKFTDQELKLMIDGQKYEFNLAVLSKRLLNAKPEERNTYKVSASGYGIHWPLIDEDLSIDGLLKNHVTGKAI